MRRKYQDSAAVEGEASRFFKKHKKALIVTAVIIIAAIVCVSIINGVLTKQGFESSTIATSDTVKIGIRTDIEGFGAIDESGNITGFDRDYVDAVLKALLGDQPKIYEYYSITSQDAAGEMKYGGINIALGLLTEGVNKTSGFRLTTPYYTDKVVAVVRSDSRLEKITNLEGGTIGVLSNAISADDLKDYIKDSKMNYNTSEVLRYSDYESAREDLEAGRVTAVVMPKVIASRFVEEGFRMVAEPLYEVGYCIMLPTGQAAVQTEMNRVIEQFEQDGTAQALREKWGL